VNVGDGDEEFGCVWVAVIVLHRFVEELGDAADEVNLAAMDRTQVGHLGEQR
jgi:hypothetical protein